jgi:hypothetical protein
VWWLTPVIPVLGRLRKEDQEFKDSLGCIMTPYDKEDQRSWAQWLMPVILSTQEAEIRRLMV